MPIGLATSEVIVLSGVIPKLCNRYYRIQMGPDVPFYDFDFKSRFQNIVALSQRKNKAKKYWSGKSGKKNIVQESRAKVRGEI